MEASRESVTSNYASQCEFDEETNGYEENECTAVCVSVRWIKPANVFELMFVSHDVLLLHVENTLLFYNVKTHKEELLVVVGDDESSPAAGDRFPLSLDGGIGCVDCRGTDLLALSEHSPSAKAVICRYPDMKVLATLIDSNGNAATYKSIKLTKSEYLIGLRDYPAFDLVVWAWTVEEILLVVDTGFRLPDQSLKLDAASPGRDVCLSQTERGPVCRLQLWTVSVSYKTAFARRTPVECPAGADVASGCWSSPSGSYVFCDRSSANVYRTRPGAPKPETCVQQHAGNADERPRSRASVCPSADGFVLCAANELTSFGDVDGVFVRIWTISTDRTLYSMVAGDDCVYAWSDQGALLKLTHKKERQLKAYGADIRYFTFVGPTDETVATIDKTNNLRVWDVSTGELKSETRLNGIATNVCSNPVHHYVAVPFENGKVELWKTDPGANDLEEISKLVLCDDELSSVKFFGNGNRCVVTSYPTGRFYHIHVKLGRTCVFVGASHWKKRIVDFEIFENEESSTSVIAAVYADEPSTGTAGNSVVVFDAKFNVVFETKDTRCYYTSVFKWTAGVISDAPDIVNIAFGAMKSKHVHVMTVNIKTRRSELKTVPVGHRLAPDGVKAHVRKNHCVTFGGDGAYRVYRFGADDGPPAKAVTVNGCGQWQTGGLTAARIDVGARHVLTLSRRGNLVCTSFGRDGDDDDGPFGRDRRPDDRPAFVESMKTGGIGFEDAPGRKRTTLMRMIDGRHATDPVFVAIVNRIQEEFEQIRGELVRLLDANDNAPEDWKLDLEELDLNVDRRRMFREQSDTERRRYGARVVREIAESEAQRNAVVREHWESLSVTPKSLHCFNKWYRVSNYPITKTEQDVFADATGRFEGGPSTATEYGKTWRSACNKSHTETSSDNNTALSDSEYNRLINNETFTGSISHQFVDISDNLNFFPNDYTAETVKDEIAILRFTVGKLKRSFNRLFDESFAEKQNQLNDLNAHNERLRVIENELRLTFKIEPTVHSTADYRWNPYEQTERLLRVEDGEVSAKPYRRDPSPVPSTGETASAKRYRFRRYVLDEVWSGILEMSWAEKLRTDVAKPQCMLKRKRREDYTEDDLVAVVEYVRAVTAKNRDRALYRRSLEDEQTDIGRRIVNVIRESDGNVVELYGTRAKYDAAIDQERLKVTRLSKALHEDDQQKRRIRLLEQADSETKRTIEEIDGRIANVKEAHCTLLGTVETLRGKIKRIDKRFKSEFRSKSARVQASIVYDRRPRVPTADRMSAPLLDYVFVETITDPSSGRADRLHAKFTRYLDALDTYDDYNEHSNENKPYDEPTWRTICHYRRLRIQSEFHIVACQNEATDKVRLLDGLTRERKAMVKRFKSSTVNKLKNRTFHYEPDIQLVIRLGYAELKLSGHVEDFNNATFVPRVSIEKMIAKVEEVGQLKTDALSDLAALENKIRSIKPKHEILKEHKMPLFKYRHNYISNMGVSSNVLLYLKCIASGVDMVEQAQLKLDEELLTIKYVYDKIKTRLNRKLDGQTEAIGECERKNIKFDVDVRKAFAGWSALHVKIDHDLTGQLKSACAIKTKRIMTRAKMMSSLQKVQKEIVMLQTELEALRLKRDPTV